jgi:uncharacterized protein
MAGGGDRAPGIPVAAGIGLRAPHVDAIIATRPAVAWLEVHPENYMGGGPAVRRLEQIRLDYPLSLHGVGLSLGSAEDLDARHLRRLAALVERVEPALISEHLSWSIAGGRYFNHLLPLPYTDESLDALTRHIEQLQHVLGRRVLIENPSAYLRFKHSPIPEPEFLNELARRTGCGLLCDVNNIYVTAHNLGLDPVAYLDALPLDTVGEIHLAGHSANDADGQTILIDDHGSRVSPEVWQLYQQALARFGPTPTLVEWDTDIPTLDVLLEEARVAEKLLSASRLAMAHADAR